MSTPPSHINSNSAVTGEENKSSSTMSTITPYYGSREPKQSVVETDRVIFQMMDDIQISIQPKMNKEEEAAWNHSDSKLVPVTNKSSGTFWRFRIVISSILILLLVVATVVISEVTKKVEP